MSHGLVLVALVSQGPGWDLTTQLDKAMGPYWELDLSQEEAASDPRAEFRLAIPSAELEAEFHSFLERNAVKVGINNAHATAEDWAEQYHGYAYSDVHDGWGYWHNPVAKWDWYEIGGRWSGFFRTQDGRTCDAVRVKELSEEQLHRLTTLAFIDKDGEWHERSTLGWWGMSTMDPSGWEVLSGLSFSGEKWEQEMSREWLPGTREISLEEAARITEDLLGFFSWCEDSRMYVQKEAVSPQQEYLEAQQLDEENGVERRSYDSTARRVYRLFETLYGIKWDQEYFDRFIAPLDEDDWLVAVDFHI